MTSNITVTRQQHAATSPLTDAQRTLVLLAIEIAISEEITPEEALRAAEETLPVVAHWTPWDAPAPAPTGGLDRRIQDALRRRGYIVERVLMQGYMVWMVWKHPHTQQKQKQKGTV